MLCIGGVMIVLDIVIDKLGWKDLGKYFIVGGFIF